MPIDRAALVTVIEASNGAAQPVSQLDSLLSRLTALESTGRYGALLGSIAKCNDNSNALALFLEATFASSLARLA